VSVPSIHKPYILAKVHDAVQELLSAIGMKMGALNFDIMVSNDNEVFILEIGPRNGGNMIPELIEFSTNVDLKEYSIKAALGIDCSDLKQTIEKPYFSHYVIHSENNGTVSNIQKSPELKSALLYEHSNFKIGDQIVKFSSSANRLGVMLLKYANKEEMLSIIENMNLHYKIDMIYE
jgi:biotin carboxylase